MRPRRRIHAQVLRHGATPSHHHGTGYELLPWIPRHLGETGVKLLQGIKHSVDPANICNPGKLIPGETPSLSGYWPDDVLKGPSGARIK